MKTKYIKVAVSDRLPEESDYFNTDDGWVQFNKYDKKFWLEGVYEVHPQYWLEEIPDYEEEMREMLEKVCTELYRTDNSMATEVKTLLNTLK